MMELTLPHERGRVLAEKPVIWSEELAPAVPYLVPSLEGEPVEVLPTPEKRPTSRLRWAEDVELCEIENRFQLEDMYGAGRDDDDDNSYEIEIVEDDGDADFYLEIVDGEIFYVFETEDDMSDDDSDEDDSDDDSDDSDDSDSDNSSSEESSDSEGHHGGKQPLQLPIESMMAPQLDFDRDPAEALPVTQFDPNQSGGIAQFNPDDSFANIDFDLMGSGGEGEDEDEEMTNVEDVSDSSAKDQQASPESSDKNKVFGGVSSSSPSPGGPVVKSPASAPSRTVKVSQEDLAGPAVLIEPESSSEDQQQQQPQQPSQQQQQQRLFESGIVTPVASPEAVQKPKIIGGSSPAAPASPASYGSPVKSILKACPPSPISPGRRKNRKNKGGDKGENNSKKEKTVTKRYVRADNFDGEQMVYSWEKPKWTDKELKKTDKGENVRGGGDIANPITFPKKNKSASGGEETLVYADDKGNTIDKDELIRRIQEGDSAAVAFVPLPTYGGKHQKKLKCSVQGEKMRQGVDLAKNITMATVNKERADINLLANKNVLKNKVEVVKRQYSWQKPAWARSEQQAEGDTTSSRTGDTSTTTSSAITRIEEKKKEYKWEKPSWIKPKLCATEGGQTLKNGKDLQKPITHIQSKTDGNETTTTMTTKPELQPQPGATTTSHS